MFGLQSLVHESDIELLGRIFADPDARRRSDAGVTIRTERNAVLRLVSRTLVDGARNPKVMAAIQGHGMRSILWNIDTRDWADPVPASIANRAIATVEAEHRGIILFHDIQARTVEALPLVLETLLARGYRPVRFRALENAPAADAREAGSLAQQIKGGQTDSDAKDRSSRQPANERTTRHHKKHSARN